MTTSALVARFQAAMAARDLAALSTVLSPDVRFLAPNSMDGGASPRAQFTGYDEVVAYFATILSQFSQVLFSDVRITQADDGDTVFFEAAGDFVHAASGVPYRNRYVFRFDLCGDHIGMITEYDNPMIFRRTFGLD